MSKSSEEHINIQTVKKNGNDIRHIKNPSENVKRVAVKQNGMAIAFIADPSEEVQRLAILQNPYAIGKIKKPTLLIEVMYFEHKGSNLSHLLNPSDTIIKLFLDTDACYHLQFLKDPSRHILEYAMSKDADCIEHVKNPDVELQKKAVLKKPSSVRYIDSPTEEVKLLARLMGYTGDI